VRGVGRPVSFSLSLQGVGRLTRVVPPPSSGEALEVPVGGGLRGLLGGLQGDVTLPLLRWRGRSPSGGVAMHPHRTPPVVGVGGLEASPNLKD